MIRLLSLGIVALVCMGTVAQEKPAPVEDRITIVLDAAKKIQMEFVRIRAGTFTMGDKDFKDATPHEVTITKDYWMQTTETTQAQWESVMGKNPSKFKGVDLPVELAQWEECEEFLKKLNERVKEQLKGKSVKLPTEAEWEYACRGGENGKWCFGDDEKLLDDYAWYSKNSDEKTHPVGQKKPNTWGLYDMHGNVWEGCADRYERYPSEAVTDPVGAPRGEVLVLRGGAWDNHDWSTRSANRDRWMASSYCLISVGVRCALR